MNTKLNFFSGYYIDWYHTGLNVTAPSYCHGANCDPTFAQWEDGSPWSFDDVANLSSNVINLYSTQSKATFLPTTYALDGASDTEYAFGVCTRNCTDTLPCYQVATLTSKFPKLKFTDAQEVCTSYGESLIMLRTLKEVTDFYEWHYSDSHLAAGSDTVHLGLKPINPSSIVSCSNEDCDSVLEWADGSPLVYDDIKLLVDTVQVSTNHDKYYLHLSLDTNYGKIIYSTAGDDLRQSICTAPCSATPPETCYQAYNSYNSDPVHHKATNRPYICQTFGLGNPVLKSHRAVMEYFSWYKDTATITGTNSYKLN